MSQSTDQSTFDSPAARPARRHGRRGLPLALAVPLAAAAALTGCRSAEPVTNPENALAADAPPPAIAAWMQRLTVRHHYDPATGFIVADETIALPPVLARAPDARTLVAFGREHGVPVVVFATADRCAPCQQFKRDALNDPEVQALLESGGIFATHLEVDRDPEAARELMGSTAIPVSWLFREGRVVDRLGGQRSAAELRDWLRQAAGTAG